MTKNTKLPLAHLKLKFYGKTTPKIWEVDDNDLQISRPHVEVSRVKVDGSRYFESKVFRPGRYAFSGFNFDVHHPLYLVFQNCRSGWFVVDEKRNILVSAN